MSADNLTFSGPRDAAIVVKLGGSLYNSVPALVPILRSAARPLLIIPGGGPFANAVRDAGLDDETAHWKAIGAMDRYGHYIASHGLPVTKLLSVPEHTTILLPTTLMREQDPLPHSWDITSDTIAAWVAAELRLDLVLLKSIDGIAIGDTLLENVNAPLETEAVDPLFIPYVLEKRVNTFMFNGSRPENLARFLKGDTVPGTHINQYNLLKDPKEIL